MPNSLQSSAIASPASRRATNCSLSSITEHSFQGITPSPLRGESVTYVSGTMCYLCLRPLITSKYAAILTFLLSGINRGALWTSVCAIKTQNESAKRERGNPFGERSGTGYCYELNEPLRRPPPLLLLPKYLPVSLAAIGIKAITLTVFPSGFQLRRSDVPVRPAFLQHSAQVLP